MDAVETWTLSSITWADEIMLFSRVESAKKSAPESAPETSAKC